MAGCRVTAAATAPPDNPQLLAAIRACWCEVLATNAFSDDDHFFLAGGDSLQLARLLARVQQQLQVQLQWQDLVRFSTPRKMAMWCARQEKQVMPAHSAHDQQQADRYPACAMQCGLWFDEQQCEGSGQSASLYSHTVLLDLHGPLAITALTAALTDVLYQHPLLRSSLRFERKPGLLMGCIAALSPVSLWPQPLALVDRHDYVRHWAGQPLVLEQPLFRYQLLQHQRDHHSLLLCCHHCISDGWSGTVLLRSLCDGYNRWLTGSRPQSLSVDNAFVGYCRGQQQYLQAGAHALKLAWWQSHLGSARTTHSWLQPASPPPPWPYRIARLEFTIDKSLQQLTSQCCQQRQMTLFPFLLTALKSTLAATSGLSRQIVGFPVAGRSSAVQENSIGCYINMLMTCDDMALGAAPGQLLAMVNHHVQQALAYAVPFQQLVQSLRPSPLPDSNLWFDVVLAVQNFPQWQPQWAGLQCSVFALPVQYSRYPLKLEWFTDACGWRLYLDYATALLSEDAVNQLVASLLDTMLSLTQT